MQLSMEEFEYMLGKVRDDAYNTGRQQGQQDVIDKQQAELKYKDNYEKAFDSAQPLGAPEKVESTYRVAQSSRAVPRPPATSPHSGVDDTF